MIDRFHAFPINQGYAISSDIDVIFPQKDILRCFLWYIVTDTGSNGTGALKKKREGLLQGCVFSSQFFFDHGADHLVNDSAADGGQ